MKLTDFDYRLPPELVAQRPAPRRDASRLLVLHSDGRIDHRSFADFPSCVGPRDLLALNDTRVVPARLVVRRATGGRVDALLVRAVDNRRWETLLDTSRKLQVGERLKIDDCRWCRIAGRAEDGRWLLEFDADVGAILRELGRPPLPPYIRRDAGPEDAERYQTVYAEREGAIAAPTAGLHFTRDLLEAVERRVPIAKLTLHVGVGTFKPVKVANIDEHRMEPEWYAIGPDAERAVSRALSEGRRILAVGTTTCRALESWARTGRASGWTDLFIRPPFDFRAAGALLTNFHLPKSTLLMLACAFAGRERVLAAYEEAIRRRYRFFSYGDAMLLLR